MPSKLLTVGKIRKMREMSERAVRERLAARDAAYAASPCAARTTRTVRGGAVVETRGNVCTSPRIDKSYFQPAI